jgi:hypothetical protein
MSFPRLLRHGWLLLSALAGAISVPAANPIGLLPANPHYFTFRGQPTVIVTSGEHYGAVVNRAFDYVRYLDTLAEDGLNGTRVFLAYREQPGAFNIAANSLAPKQDRLVLPWARSTEPGYFDGGNRYDLTRWDEAYFGRLRDFVKHAGQRGIVVEANLFSCFYGDKSWETHPFHHRNNVNGVGQCAWDEALSLRDPKLVGFMDAYVRKLVAELRGFDNVTFEICNEPYIGGVDMKWHDHIADVLAAALRPGPGEAAANLSATHPTTHLVSWNVANGTAVVTNPHPALALFNFHYATPPDAVKQNRGLNRPIGDNETGFRGTNDAPYRMEAWDFLFAGGALFNHLDYSFVAGHERGDFAYPKDQPGGGSPKLRVQLGFLAGFLRTFDLGKTRPDTTFLRGGVPDGVSAEALVEAGRRWAVYLRPASLSAQFSVRWTGTLTPTESGEYTLHTVSNDGVRLWVDGRQLIDNWSDHAEQEDSATVRLVAGQPVPVRLEYFYGGGQGVTRLSWTRPDGTKEIVPASRLTRAGGQPGLRGEYFSGTQLQLGPRVLERVDATINFPWGADGFLGRQARNPATQLTVELPAGRYVAEWFDPVAPKSLGREEFNHPGGTRPVPVRQVGEETVLRLERQ